METRGDFSLQTVAQPAVSAQPARWQVALDQYLRQLDSAQTVQTYRRNVRQFFETPGAPDLDTLTPAHLDAYRGHLLVRCGLLSARDNQRFEGQRLAPETVKIRLASLRSFLLWLVHERGLDQGIDWLPASLTPEQVRYRLRGVRSTTERPYEVIESAREQMAVIVAATQERTMPARARALVALALGAGLRISELRDVRLADLGRDASGFYVRVRQGKGRKGRVVPIAQQVYDWCAVAASESGTSLSGAKRAAHGEAPLFVSRKGRKSPWEPLQTQQARRIILRVVKRAAESEASLRGRRISPHGLRHSYAIDTLRGSTEEGRQPAPVTAVSMLLGHSNIAVTSRYVRHLQRGELAQYAPTFGQVGGAS